MLIEAAIGNLTDEMSGIGLANLVDTECDGANSNASDRDVAHAFEIDWLDLTWAECGRRAARKTSRGGRAIRLLLGLGITLRHGDILWQADDGSTVIAINVLPCELIVARPKDARESTCLAYEIGNLHSPMEIHRKGSEIEIVAINDGPIAEVLDRLGVAFDVQTRRFAPTFWGTEPMQLSKNFAVRRKV